MKNRLIELLIDSSQYLCDSASLIETIADHLIANGVIVPPCKVGDMVYRVYRESNIIVEESVISVGVDKEGIFIETSAAMYYELHFNWLLYFTQAEAEKALAERGK